MILPPAAPTKEAIWPRAPGRSEHADPDGDDPAFAHQLAHDHLGQQSRIDIAARQHQADLAPLEQFGIAQQSGQPDGAGPFGDRLFDRQEQRDGMFDVGLVDQQHSSTVRRTISQGQRSDILDGDAFGDGFLADADRFAPESLTHRRIGGDLHANTSRCPA